MADKEKELREVSQEEMEQFFQEETEETVPDFDLSEDYKDNTILMHCKPVYNFQSIEFDMAVDVNNPEAMEEMKGVYSAVLKILQDVAVDQPAQVKPKPLPSPENTPSDKMKETMDRYGIKYDKYTTKKEAQVLIQQSLEKDK